MGKKTCWVDVSGADRAALEQWLRAQSIPQALATRARIVLDSAAGESVRSLARRLGGTAAAPSGGDFQVQPRPWRKTNLLGQAPRAPMGGGFGPTQCLITACSLAAVIRRGRPARGRVCSVRSELADVVGLYLDPSERALVLCVDEKSQIQAPNCTQPALPMWPGLPARMSHDYTRHGTTSLFAALEVASGKVHARCFRRHRRELRLVWDERVEEGDELGVSIRTHKHPAVVRWLAAHPRFHLHFTPTGASWLNLVERWFALITDQAIRRGSFESVRRLERAIMRWLAHWNEQAKPFRWTKSATRITRSIRNPQLIYETEH